MSARLTLLGGGQLARMSALAAFRLGFQVGVVAPGEPAGPAADLATRSWHSAWEDEAQQREVAAWSPLLSLENEFLPVSVLEGFGRSGAHVVPFPGAVARIQDKFLQKTLLEAAGVPVTPFAAVGSEGEIKTFGEQFGWPVMLKSRMLGYDGYGNARVESAREAGRALNSLGHRAGGLLVEAWVSFVRELALMAVRNVHGTVMYPLVETRQANHVCHAVLAPASGSLALRPAAQRIAALILDALGSPGLFGIEFFELEDGALLVNEIAPRPHNSGHYTIEACVTSQFENHVRAVAGLPLGLPQMVAPAAAMVNILGKSEGPTPAEALAEALAMDGVHVHLYGKQVSRPGRKMGHVTVLGATVEDALERAKLAADLICI